MKFERESLSQFLSYHLSGQVQSPIPLKVTRTASIFESPVIYISSLTPESFAAIDESRSLFVWYYHKIQWDNQLKNRKKVYKPYAKIDLNKLQDQFNNNVFQPDEALDEKILLEDQMKVRKVYTKEDLRNIAKDMKGLVQSIDKFNSRRDFVGRRGAAQKRSQSTKTSGGGKKNKGYRIKTRNKSMYRKRNK